MNRYTWLAVYNDGTSLLQYNDDKEISVDALDKKKLYQFRLINEEGSIIFAYEFKKGQYPFYRRRTAINPEGVLEVIHIIGQMSRINGEQYTNVAFVYESSGRIEVGDFNCGAKWKHPIEFHDNDSIAVE